MNDFEIKINKEARHKLAWELIDDILHDIDNTSTAQICNNLLKVKSLLYMDSRYISELMNFVNNKVEEKMEKLKNE